jgi:nucleotide-binding universal stress UspA family protein
MDAFAHGKPVQSVRSSDETTSVIVVGFGGGAASLRAAAFAIGIAARQRADLLFLQVWEQPTCYGLLPQILPLDHEAMAAAEPGLRGVIAELIGDLGLRWELRQSIGNPSIELERLAQEVWADALIVGSSRRRVRRLLGSIGGNLVRAGRCPVTVVP